MTNDRDNHDPGVSEAYRRLATEETPADLDERVLAMAAREARTRYGLARAWMRPVAWAATIGLSLAFVLEMSQLNNVQAPDAATPAVLDERARSEQDVMKAKDDNRIHHGIGKRQDIPTAPEPAAESVEEAVVPTAESPARLSAPAVERASVAQDLDAGKMLREAEEQAGASVSDIQPAVAAFAEKKELAQHCAAEAMATAEDWYACIETLREEGRTDDAAAEFEALLAQFPDFREPAPSR